MIGLHEFPKEDWPPLVIHYYFNIMVVIGVWMIVLSGIFVAGMWRNWAWIHSNWFRILIVLGGPLSVIAIEAGWWLAEVGRQPWIMYGIMRTAEGATTASGVENLFIAFAIVYIVLGIGCAVVMHRMFKGNPIAKELASRKGGEDSWH